MQRLAQSDRNFIIKLYQCVKEAIKKLGMSNADRESYKALRKMDSTKKNSIVVFVNAVDKAKSPIMCAINIQGEGYYNSVKIDTNLIASAYGKDNNPIGFIKRAVDEDRVLYWDKKMSQTLFEIPGLQLPDNLNRLSSNVIIRKTNANVNGFSQNSSKKVEKISTSRKSIDVDSNVEKQTSVRYFLPVNVEADVKKYYGNTYRWNETGDILQDGNCI